MALTFKYAESGRALAVPLTHQLYLYRKEVTTMELDINNVTLENERPEYQTPVVESFSEKDLETSVGALGAPNPTTSII